MEYQLEYKTDMSKAWHDACPQGSSFMNTNYKLCGLETCGEHLFRGRAISTNFNEGLYSDYLQVKTECDFCNPGPILKYRHKCALEIDWSKCYSCADEDTATHQHYNGQFHIEVMGRDG